MKKIITLLILFTASCIVAQDVTVTLGRGSASYRDTLTATIDSIKINAVQTNNIFTIYAYTTTGTDTINVYTTPKGYTLWSQKSLVDLSTNSVVTQIIATTTPKEYLLQDPEMVSMLLITPDGDASTVFIVSPKSTANPVSAATPYSLPLPTGAATSANQTTLIAKADSTVDMVTAIHGDLDTVEEKLDSLDASSTRIESKLDDANAGIDSLDASSTRIEGYVDGVEAKLDSIDASSTRIEGKIDNTNTKLDSIEVTVNNIETALGTSNNYDHPASLYYAKRDTIATTAVDTIDVSTSSVWHSLSVFAVDDELQVSVDGTNWVIVPTYTTLTLSKLSSVTFTEFYVKQRDGSGSVIYDVAWIGY